MNWSKYVVLYCNQSNKNSLTALSIMPSLKFNKRIEGKRHIFFQSLCYRAQGQAAGRYRMPLACGPPANGRRICSWLWSVQECPHLLNFQRLAENQSVYCDFYRPRRCNRGSATKLGSGFESPGRQTSFPLYAQSRRVCSFTNIRIQALLRAQAVAPLDSEQT